MIFFQILGTILIGFIVFALFTIHSLKKIEMIDLEEEENK